jgi:heme-degrading monooxygenase HmoA
MFTVIYSFQIKPNQQIQFTKAWREMTILIRDCEGGLGSRLHQESELHYVAYAQWPDKSAWENAGSKLPENANAIRQTMREACIETKTLFELNVVEDLLLT